MTDEPREITKDEAREMFLDHVRGLVTYWDGLKDKTQRERLEGFAFSILAAIDGCSIDLPGWILAPYPHPDDKQFNLEEECENWWPQNHEANVACDISGDLHELFYGKKP